MNQIAIAAAGFSVFALILLVFQNRTESTITKILANSLLCILLLIQILQCLVITTYLLFEGITALVYLLLLGLVGPIFYSYSQHILHSGKKYRLLESIYILPVILIALCGTAYPEYFKIAYYLMFLLGGLYMLRLVFCLYQLRQRRVLFKMEFMLTASFLVWAIFVIAVAVFSMNTIEHILPVQVIMLSLAIAAAIHIQLNYPHLLSSLEEIARGSYQSTTLLNIDCEGIKQQLTTLMCVNKVYQDSELSLTSLAEMLSIKPHQLSELINTQLGIGFSYYLRQQRVQAAELLLESELDTSVLAIGLMVGFRSQSAFYSAFKEIHASAPGQYRRNRLHGEA